MKEKNEIKYGAILGYVNILIKILINLLYTPIILKYIGQGDYGLYTLAVSIIGYLSILDFGFGNAIIRELSKAKANNDTDKEKNICGMFLILYTLIGMLAFISGLFILKFADSIFKALTLLELEKMRKIILISIVTISLSFPLSVFDSYIVANEKFTFARIINILSNICIPLIIIPLLLVGKKLISMVLVINAVNIIFSLFKMIFCFLKLNISFTFDLKIFRTDLFKEILVYSFYIFLNIVVDSIFNNTDQIILGSVCGSIAVSVYGIASQIKNISQLFSTTISGLFLPKVTKMLEHGESEESVSNLFIRISRIQIYIMMLIISGFVVFGKSFINLWAGIEYAEAYFIFLIVMIPSIVPLTQNVALSILQVKNKHKFRSIIYIFISILNIAISIPLASKYSGIGAAIGSAVALLIGQIIIMNIYYYKVIHIDIIKYWKFLMRFSLPILGLIFVFKSLNLDYITSWRNLFMYIAAYSILYCFIAYFYLNEDEKMILFSFLKNKKCIEKR